MKMFTTLSPRTLAAISLIALGSSMGFARTASSIPDIAGKEAAQAQERLSHQNDKQVHEAIDALMSNLRAEAGDPAIMLATPTIAVRPFRLHGKRFASGERFHRGYRVIMPVL